MRTKYAKIYINSEEKEFRIGTGTFCYGRIHKKRKKPYKTDGQQLHLFSVHPLKEKPERIDYYLENKDVLFLSDNNTIYERQIIKIEED